MVVIIVQASNTRAMFVWTLSLQISSSCPNISTHPGLFATALSWVGFLIAGTTWVCSVLITISILTDPSLDRTDGDRVVTFHENNGNNWEDGPDASTKLFKYELPI